jgi:hypothetical protein
LAASLRTGAFPLIWLEMRMVDKRIAAFFVVSFCLSGEASAFAACPITNFLTNGSVADAR